MCIFNFCDFYFVDPPYVSPFDFVLLTDLLGDKNFKRPLIAWYPILKDIHPMSTEFGLPKIEYKFEEGKLLGCGIVFKNISKTIIAELEKLC